MASEELYSKTTKYALTAVIFCLIFLVVDENIIQPIDMLKSVFASMTSVAFRLFFVESS
jgi:hypothetical protein